MKKICLVLSLIVPVSVFAQFKKDSSRFEFNFGFSFFAQNFAGFNSRLANHPEYAQLNQIQDGLAFGWTAEQKKVITEFHFSIANNVSGDGEKTNSQLTSFGMNLNMGYNLSKDEHTRFYPFAGVGWERFNARLNKDVSSVSFDSLLNSSVTLQRTSSVNFSNIFLTYSAGIALDCFGKKSVLRGFSFKAGYIGGFSSYTWRVNDNQLLLNAPADNLSRWFFSGQFIIPGFRRHHHVAG